MQIVFGAILGAAAEADDALGLSGIRESGAMAADDGGHAFAYVCHLNKINFAAVNVIIGDDDSLDSIATPAIETVQTLRKKIIADTAFISSPKPFA